MPTPLYLGPVAGTFAKAAGKDVKPGDVLHVEAEPSNKYDPAAVLVTRNAFPVGYIPRKDTAGFHSALLAGQRPAGVVIKWNWPNQSLVQWEVE